MHCAPSRAPRARCRSAGWTAGTGAVRDATCVLGLILEPSREAATDFTALIAGETGSGKELVARQVYDLSGRHQGLRGWRWQGAPPRGCW